MQANNSIFTSRALSTSKMLQARKQNLEVSTGRSHKNPKHSKSSVFVHKNTMEQALTTIFNNSMKEQKVKPECQGKSPLTGKEQEVLELKQKLSERESELRNLKKFHMLAPMNVSDLSLQDPPNFNSGSCLQDLMNIYNNLCMKLSENHKKLEIRMKTVLNLSVLLEESGKNGIHQRDVFKIVETLKELSETLESVSKNEIELNYLYREIEKKTIENQKLKVNYEKMKARAESFETRVRELEKRQQLLTEENGLMLRSVQQETAKQQESGRKVTTLRTRLEAIVQNSHNQYIVNTSIKELMKENDGLKWAISSKTAEIERLSEVNQQLKGKVVQLTKKVDNLSQRKKKDGEEFFLAGKNETLPLLSSKATSLPNTLDFKFINLKPEYSSMLNDLAVYGPSAFASQISGLENAFQRKAAVDFITSLYLNWREFAENLNVCLSETITLLQSCHSIQELMFIAAKNLKLVFKCEEALIWIEDSETGIIYTIDGKQNELRALKESGVFKDVLETKVAINIIKETPIYVNSFDGKEKVRDRTIVFPIISPNRDCIGLIEITKYSSFDFNDEYTGLLLRIVIQIILTKIKSMDLLKKQIKFEQLFQDFLIEISQLRSKQDLSNSILLWSKRIFSISSTRFLFIENGYFLEYNPNQVKKTSLSCGLAGIAVSTGRPLIFAECEKNKDFDPTVDISTILPVFFIPLLIKSPEGQNEPIGILEIVLKSARGNEIPENLECFADRFAKIVETGYKLSQSQTPAAPLIDNDSHLQ